MYRSSSCLAILTIGGVGLRLRSEAHPLGSYDSSYLPFLDAHVGREACLSTIEITVVDAPVSANESPVIFETGGAWMMQAEDQGYRLSFHREGSRLFHTVACSDASTSRVQVYARQDEVGPESPPDSPPSPVRYPLDQLLLMNHLAPLGGVIAHAAAAVVEGRALVFPGASGAGKSTISRLFMDAGLGDSLLSDDRVILRTDRGAACGLGDPRSLEAARGAGVEAWGTPWPGDAQVARNAAAPVAALLFLVKADASELRALSSSAAVRRLLPVVTCPWYDADRFPDVLDTCARIVEQTPCYDLRFRPDADVVELLTGRSWATESESV
jgi:hypothetical protein